nr:hypothetical protein Puna18p_00106 [Serratia proteamaculans]
MSIIVTIMVGIIVMLSTSYANDGVIHFMGSISEPACVVETSDQPVQLQCVRSSVKKVSTIVSESIVSEVPYSLGDVTFFKKSSHIQEVNIIYK